MTSTSGDGPPPGWYPDPHDPGRQRFWDGESWTERRQPSGAATGQDDTAVLPQVDHPASPSARPVPERRESGGRGWVPALVGLVVGLILGGTAAAVAVGNDDSSTPTDESSSVGPASTATTTATAAVTETVSETTTDTATATVTVTESASP